MLYGERPMEAISATSKHIELHVFEYQARGKTAEEGTDPALPLLVRLLWPNGLALDAVITRFAAVSGEHDRRLPVCDGGAGAGLRWCAAGLCPA